MEFLEVFVWFHVTSLYLGYLNQFQQVICFNKLCYEASTLTWENSDS